MPIIFLILNTYQLINILKYYLTSSFNLILLIYELLFFSKILNF